MAIITAVDLSPFGLSNDSRTAAMIEDAMAQAVTVAPCLIDDPAAPLTAIQKAAAKSVLRAVIVRWSEAGSGAVVTHSQSAQGFSTSETLDTSQQRRGVFWPSEITMLQAICKAKPKAFLIDMGTDTPTASHLPWCSLSLGATYCSCGVDIAGKPIYEDD